MKTFYKRLIAALCIAAIVISLGSAYHNPVTAVETEATKIVAYTAATPGTAPSDVPEGYVFSGWYTDGDCTTALTEPVTDGNVYAKFVLADVLGLKAQYAANDGTIYQDETDNFEKNSTDAERANIELTDPIDIYAYRKGKIQFDFYIDYENKLEKNFIISLKDGNGNTISWTLWYARFENKAWTTVNANFSDGTLTGKTFDYQNVKAFNISLTDAVDATYTTKINNVRVIKALPGVILQECENTKEFGSDNPLPSYCNVSYDNKYVKTGMGAFYSSTSSAERFNMKFKDTKDLSAYASNGILHFWLYVESVDAWQNFTKSDGTKETLRVQLSSDNGKNYKQLTVSLDDLNSGWNKIELPLSNYASGLDWTSITTLRMHTNSFTGALKTSIDDIRIIVPNSTTEQKSLVNTEDTTSFTINNSAAKITSDSEFVKDGTNAIYSNSASEVRFEITFGEPKDLSTYSSDGSLHFWLYVRSVDDWKASENDLRVQLYNGDKVQQNTAGYSVLENGWNEIELPLSAYANKGLDLTSITKIRMHTGNFKTNCVMSIDDICVTNEIPEDDYLRNTAAIRFVTTVDSLQYQNVGFKIKLNNTVRETSSDTVYSGIYGWVNDEANLIKPDEAFCSISKYFSTSVLYNIPRSAFRTDIEVTPYWVTLDGTKVYGTAKNYSVAGLEKVSNQGA